MFKASNTAVFIYVDDFPGSPEAFNQYTGNANIIITSTSRQFFYKNDTGVLSVKSVFKGSAVYQTDNSCYTVNKANYLVLNPGTGYSCRVDSDTDVEAFAIHFSPQFVDEVYRGLLTATDHLPGFEAISALFPELIEKTYDHDQLVSPSVFAIRSLVSDFQVNRESIVELFHELLRNLLRLNDTTLREIGHIDVAKLSTKIEIYKRLSFAKDYIESCYSQDISLDMIAKVACMNSEYFIRQFKKQYQVTPIQYLIRKRMKVAKELLNSLNISVSEVCHGVGYSDLTSFGKLFKRYYGITPENQIRKQN